ncbi:MAG TPA: hypothetical protein ENK75_05885 [Saprospiraceae bacterium]|nr:hypothetical protein [Saprospiraceae bacterium]
MIRCLLLLIVFPWSLHLSGQVDLFQGYLITLDGKRLGGQIGAINRVHNDFYLYFENDFGTDYNIRPQLIKGFSLFHDSFIYIYESHNYNGKWIYLQVIYPGDEILLYQTPNIQVNWIQDNERIQPYIPKHKRLWIKPKNHKITKINRLNYKRKLKKLFHVVAPKLSKKIGKPGYRFKNIFSIIKEYNEQKKKTKARVLI